MFDSITKLIARAKERDIPLWRVMLETEMALTEQTEEEIFVELAARYAVMARSVEKTLDAPLPALGGLIDGNAMAQNTYAKSGGISGGLINKLMARALSGSEVHAW